MAKSGLAIGGILCRVAFMGVLLLGAAGAAWADDSPAPVAGDKTGLMPVEPDYVRLTPITFSVIGADNQIDEEVTILLSIEMANGNKETALGPYTARIQDSFLVTLTDLWDSRPIGGSRVTDAEVKEKLLSVARSIAGANLVSSVLVLGISEKLR